MELEQAKTKLRDVRMTPVQFRALVGLVDAVQQTHVGPAAFAILRRTVVDVAREAGTPV